MTSVLASHAFTRWFLLQGVLLLTAPTVLFSVIVNIILGICDFHGAIQMSCE